MTRGLPPLPAPTPEDFAAATVLVDNWFEADGILPGFRRNWREFLIQRAAERERNERLRREPAIRAVEEMARKVA